MLMMSLSIALILGVDTAQGHYEKAQCVATVNLIAVCVRVCCL